MVGLCTDRIMAPLAPPAGWKGADGHTPPDTVPPMALQDKKRERKEKGKGGAAKPAEAAKDNEPRVDQLDIRCGPAELPDIKAS